MKGRDQLEELGEDGVIIPTLLFNVAQINAIKRCGLDKYDTGHKKWWAFLNMQINLMAA